MNNLLDNISRYIGLTKTEISTSLFVLVVFIFGWVADYTKSDVSNKKTDKFDYSFQDSLFKALHKKDDEQTTTLKKKEKRVDSEVELSDFSRKKKVSKQNTSQPDKHSININTADEKTLTKLPGIGKTLANRIVEYRRNNGDYRTLDELLEVNRIGLKKLNSIKKFIFIEK